MSYITDEERQRLEQIARERGLGERATIDGKEKGQYYLPPKTQVAESRHIPKQRVQEDFVEALETSPDAIAQVTEAQFGKIMKDLEKKFAEKYIAEGNPPDLAWSKAQKDINDPTKVDIAKVRQKAEERAINALGAYVGIQEVKKENNMEVHK